MPRKITLLPLLALAFSGIAAATTVSLNAEYLNLDLGIKGAPESQIMPGLQLKGRQNFEEGYSAALSVTGAKGSRLTYLVGHLAFDKAFSAGFGYFRSGVHLGYRVLQGEGSRLSAANAGVGLTFFVPITPSFDAFLSAGAGKTFMARLNGTSLSGGLYYSGSAGFNYAVGPGAVNLAYKYQHFGLDSVSESRMSTQGVLLGYRIAF